MSQASGSNNKRQKGPESSPSPPVGIFPPGNQFGQQQFQQPPYGAQPPPPGGQQQFQMQQQPGYMWQPGQQQPPAYSNQTVPGHWQNGQQPPGMFRQSPPTVGPPHGPPMPLDPPGNSWNGYRGQPPPPSNASQSQGRHGGKDGPQKSGSKSPPTGSYQPWGQQQQQWSQNQWGGGAPPPPQMWQQGQPGPPMHPPHPSPPPGPQHMQGQPMGPMNAQHPPWPASGPSSTQGRPMKGRPRGSPDSMLTSGGFPMNGMPRDILCQQVGMDPASMRQGQDVFVTSQGVGTGHDEDSRSKPSGGSSVTSKDKGRGSYRCGRCGAPKKGHVCPYQPKLKRRPEEPPPVLRNAAVQVEMDEFLTLRRLNIEIQGYPESYATASHILADNRVVGEPHPFALGDSGVLTLTGVYTGNEPGQISSSPAFSESVKSETEGMRQSPQTAEVEDTNEVDQVPAENEKAEA